MKFSKISHYFPSVDSKYFDHSSAKSCVRHMLKKDPSGRLVVDVVKHAAKHAEKHHSWAQDKRIVKLVSACKSELDDNHKAKKAAKKYQYAHMKNHHHRYEETANQAPERRGRDR